MTEDRINQLANCAIELDSSYPVEMQIAATIRLALAEEAAARPEGREQEGGIIQDARAAELLIGFAREARRLMREKGSYDVKVDPRVLAEYENAYSLIQRLSFRAPEPQPQSEKP